MFPVRFELATFGLLSLGRKRKFIPLLWYKVEGGGGWMEPLPGVFDMLQ